MLGQPWKGYYLTAYGIAVKHGFVGTEEEWLASLRGEPGARALLRYNKTAKTIEWKPEGSDTWEAIVPLSELQGELVAATLKEAENAAESAGKAQEEAEDAAKTAAEGARAAEAAQKEILRNIEAYGTTIKNAYVLGDKLYISTSDGKTLTAGDVRGRKGDTGDSGVYIGTEEPQDPEVRVWIDPTGHDGMREIQNILSRLKYTDGGVQVDLAEYMREDREGITLYDNKETLLAVADRTYMYKDEFEAQADIVQEIQKAGNDIYMSRSNRNHFNSGSLNSSFAGDNISFYIFEKDKRRFVLKEQVNFRPIRQYLYDNLLDAGCAPGSSSYGGVDILASGKYAMREHVVLPGTWGCDCMFIIDTNTKQCIRVVYDAGEERDGEDCSVISFENGEIMLSRTYRTSDLAWCKYEKYACPTEWDSGAIEGWHIGDATLICSTHIQKEGLFKIGYWRQIRHRNHCYFTCGSDVWKVNDAGEAVWEKKNGEFSTSYTISSIGYGQYIYLLFDKALWKIDTESGEICWQETENISTGTLRVRNGILYLSAWDSEANAPRMKAFNCVSGEYLGEAGITLQNEIQANFSYYGAIARTFDIKDKLYVFYGAESNAQCTGEKSIQIDTLTHGTVYKFK